MKTITFTKMEDGTPEDYAFLKPLYDHCNQAVPDRLLSLLKLMEGDKMGYQVDRYIHSLQSATRAEHDGADEETIVCVLLHDIGDVIAPHNHSEVIAGILRPYISEKNYWVLKHHGLFQGYYYFHHFAMNRNLRDQFKDHEFYQHCVDFCADWDQISFDPDYENYPLEHFEPMVRRVLAEPRKNFE